MSNDINKQAFVIMQIGNTELDKLYSDHIVPAVKACDMNTLRVDKHTKGRLLKSEAVEFIQTSDFIIADLTNERPNCYLEVGYAMGLDKFNNLILTAREDHHHNSPNYKKGGPCIHFDLSGYDILFWDPKDLETFQSELIRKIKRRRLITTSTPIKKKDWDEKWISKHHDEAFEGFNKLGLSGFLEIQATLLESNIDISQNRLLELADKAQIHTFGWPIAPMANSNEDFRPNPTTEGIKNIIYSKTDRAFDFWTVRKNGDFYLLKSFFEDGREKNNELFFNTRIVRVAEVYLYLARLYTSFEIDSNTKMKIRIRHGGLNGRTISSSSNRVITGTNRTRENKVIFKVETSLDEIESHLNDLVEKTVTPLFMVFNYFKIGRDVLDDIVDNYVNGKVT
jgi:hypothetical protein